MKKFISILLCVMMICSFVGCGADKSGNEIATGNVGGMNEDEAVNEAIATEKKIEYDFSAIEGLGNDPQGLRNTSFTPAFDDEYIYFYDRDYSDIYKVAYNGQNLQRVGYEYKTPRYMNVCNGYIYYAVETMNEHVNYKVQFYRMDIATGERTLLFEQDLGSASFEIKSMLLYKDLLIAVCTSGRFKNGAGGWSGRDFTRAVAYDMKTGECYTIMAESVDAANAAITVDDNDNIYLYIEKEGAANNDTWLEKISIEDIRNGMMVLDIDIALNLDNQDILYPDGILTAGESAFMRREYNSIDMEDGWWTREDDSLINYDENVANLNVFGYVYTSKYMLEDSLLVYNERIPAEIYLVKGLDFSNIDLVYTTRFSEENRYQYSALGYGVHDDKFYYIEQDYETKAKYLAVIDSEGNVNEYTLN